MKVLVVGKGGREHAVVKKLTRDGVDTVYCAPGNDGMTEATLVPISDDDVVGLADFAEREGVDLTIVGPESALVAGLADEFAARGLRVFGPSKAAAQLEGSKAFAKELMAKYHVPTAAYAEFTDLNAALAYVRGRGLPFVIKADGLAAGKGVIIPQTMAEAETALTEMLTGDKFGAAGRKVVIEDFLDGEEFSLMSFVDGTRYYPMPVARDYKRAFDGDQGPNTGGMGAHSPNPLITAGDYQEALTKVVEPTIAALVAEGIPFTGVLYAGLIKTADGVNVIEFNVRFGDPETEVLMPLLETPLTDVIGALDAGAEREVRWSGDATVGVVLAARGYPGDYAKGAVIRGLDKLADVDVYHMGTKKVNGEVTTNGGRVLFVVARGNSLAEARKKVYAELPKINCDDLFYRTDIAAIR